MPRMSVQKQILNKNYHVENSSSSLNHFENTWYLQSCYSVFIYNSITLNEELKHKRVCVNMPDNVVDEDLETNYKSSETGNKLSNH